MVVAGGVHTDTRLVGCTGIVVVASGGYADPRLVGRTGVVVVGDGVGAGGTSGGDISLACCATKAELCTILGSLIDV